MARKRKQSTADTANHVVPGGPPLASRGDTGTAPTLEDAVQSRGESHFPPLLDGEEAVLDEDDEEEEEETPAPPTFTVANNDSHLLAFLSALADDPATPFALADWLEEHEDPRAAHVRELAEARCAVPEGACVAFRTPPMACGTWWCIARRAGSVAAHVYEGTPLYLLLNARRRGNVIVARVLRDRQTPELIREAFESCRHGLLLGLFGTSVGHLRARRVLMRGAGLDRVVQVLARYGEAAIPLDAYVQMVATGIVHGRPPLLFHEDLPGGVESQITGGTSTEREKARRGSGDFLLTDRRGNALSASLDGWGFYAHDPAGLVAAVRGRALR